jgi:hypothetical protein
MLFIVLFGGAAFLIAATLGLVFAPRPWLVMTLVAGGPVLAATWFLIGYVSAPTSKPRGDSCADGAITFCRWWEFGFFVLILVINVIAWWIGALVGVGVRRLAQRSDSTGSELSRG